MPLPLPATLSPSKVSSFTSCALAFRFSAIDRLPEPSTPAACKGTLVHRALELLFCDVPAGRRDEAAGLVQLDRAWSQLRDDPELASLALDDAEQAAFLDDARALVRSYFELEDPNRVRAIGMELRLSAQLGGMTLRGIIDRLELDDDGELVVTDYKTGRAPSERYEQGKLGGVQFYAHLCESVLGRRPAKVQLLYLRDPVSIVHVPTEQSLRGLRTRATAVWSAVERACTNDDFRPKPGPLCSWCSFTEYCPAVGGSLDALPVGRGHAAGAHAPVDALEPTLAAAAL